MALEISDPDIGFQAGFGFYLGIVVTGIAAIAGLVAGVTTATLLGIVPSTVTAVAIVGHILAKRARGLPERIGRNRRRRLACYAPAAAFAVVLVGVPAFGSIDATGRFVVVTSVLVLLSGVSAFGLERMARNRYVDALTADEPAAKWTWRKTGLRYDEGVTTAVMSLTVAVGLVLVWRGSFYGLLWTGYGTVFLLSMHFDLGDDWTGFDPSDQWNPPKIRAHDAGLVVDKSYRKTFVPWEAIEVVRLTDEELVLERQRSGLWRGWFDIRCDRSGIDDPESVLEDIERARGRATRTGAAKTEHRH